MDNKLIAYIICETETTTNMEQPKLLKEIKFPDGNGGFIRKVVAEGIVQTADEKNRNGRWYSKGELFPQLEALRTEELRTAKYLRAEVGHPDSKELSRQQKIDDNNTCARFISFRTEGNDVIATYCGTNNEKGRVFNLDLLEGCSPAWSLRALGSVVNTNNGAEVRNLKIITYDNVIYPSHTRAYNRQILSESMVETESGIMVPDKGKGLLVPIYNQSVIDYIKEESVNFKCIKESFDLFYDDITLLENGKVQLSDKDGSLIFLQLENYIHNEIMNYTSKK